MSESKDNRTSILDAAERLFAENGFAATTVRQILKDAEVSSPMLYYYFGSKRELLSVLIRERFCLFEGQARQRIEEATTAVEALRHFISATFGEVKRNPTSFRFLYSMIHSPANPLKNDQCKRMRNSHTQYLLGVLERLCPEAERARLLYAVMTFQALMMSFLFQYITGLLEELPEELAESIAVRSAAIIEDQLPVPSLSIPWQPENGSEPS